MTFQLDPRIAELVELGAGPAAPADFREGDTLRLRKILNEGLASMSALAPVEDVDAREVVIDLPDGHRLRSLWYTRAQEAPGSAAVYLHGGAMIAGSAALYDPLIRTYVSRVGVPMLVVDYRLAPEAPAGTSAGDGLAALRWLQDSAGELGVELDRIAVMGDSGGGGVAASVALLARDRAMHLAQQILIYPMLDDRTIVADPHLDDVNLFSYSYNRTAWSAVLGGLPPTEPPEPEVAAARASDLSGLAPALIEVGELDIFRDEGVAYASALWRAGISAELHVYRDMPHAYDILLIDEQKFQDGKFGALRAL